MNLLSVLVAVIGGAVGGFTGYALPLDPSLPVGEAATGLGSIIGLLIGQRLGQNTSFGKSKQGGFLSLRLVLIMGMVAMMSLAVLLASYSPWYGFQ